MQLRTILESITTDRCISLFDGYGVELTPVTTPLSECEPLLYCGVMGWSGVGIRGSLAIAGSSAILSETNPARSATARDWAAELANQLTGHLKSRLLGYGVELQLALPTVLRGEHLTVRMMGETRPLLFRDRHDGLVGIWIDFETTSRFRMTDEEDTTLSGLGGGDVIEF